MQALDMNILYMIKANDLAKGDRVKFLELYQSLLEYHRKGWAESRQAEVSVSDFVRESYEGAEIVGTMVIVVLERCLIESFQSDRDFQATEEEASLAAKGVAEGEVNMVDDLRLSEKEAAAILSIAEEQANECLLSSNPYKVNINLTEENEVCLLIHRLEKEELH